MVNAALVVLAGCAVLIAVQSTPLKVSSDVEMNSNLPKQGEEVSSAGAVQGSMNGAQQGQGEPQQPGGGVQVNAGMEGQGVPPQQAGGGVQVSMNGQQNVPQQPGGGGVQVQAGGSQDQSVLGALGSSLGKAIVDTYDKNRKNVGSVVDSIGQTIKQSVDTGMNVTKTKEDLILSGADIGRNVLEVKPPQGGQVSMSASV